MFLSRYGICSKPRLHSHLFKCTLDRASDAYHVIYMFIMLVKYYCALGKLYITLHYKNKYKIKHVECGDISHTNNDMYVVIHEFHLHTVVLTKENLK